VLDPQALVPVRGRVRYKKCILNHYTRNNTS